MTTHLTTESSDLFAAASQDARTSASTAEKLWRIVSAPVRAWLKRERVYRELMMLDDRTLADIGLHRTDITMVVQAAGQDIDPRPAANLNKPTIAA